MKCRVTPPNAKFPNFRINRASPKTLVEQVRLGLQKAIASGRYADSDRLPPRDRLAAHLGVSEKVVRQAEEGLISRGMLASRPRTGCTVTHQGPMRSYENVLIVVAETSGAYSMSVCREAMTSVLIREGYCPYSVSLGPGRHGRPDLTDLRCALDAGPEFAVIMSCPFSERPVVREIIRAGVPRLSIGGRQEGIGDNVYRLDTRYAAAVNDFAASCKKGGVRSVCQFGFGNDGFLDARLALEARGICVEDAIIPLGSVFANLEAIQHAAVKAVFRRLDAGPLPDLLFFADDYLTIGAMPALTERGVRIPHDVKVVTFANRGFGPVFTKSFARIEEDLRLVGASLGRRLVSWFRTGSFPAPEPDTCAVYVPGDTFPVG